MVKKKLVDRYIYFVGTIAVLLIVLVPICLLLENRGFFGSDIEAEIRRHLCEAGDIPHEWGEIEDVGYYYCRLKRECKTCGLVEKFVLADDDVCETYLDKRARHLKLVWTNFPMQSNDAVYGD